MQNQDALETNLRFLSYREVEELTGLSRSTIYREIRRGRFPKARLIAARKVAFLRTELEHWIENRQVAL